jgi:phage repressor protein C with HTH and peptisase S24 domain
MSRNPRIIQSESGKPAKRRRRRKPREVRAQNLLFGGENAEQPADPKSHAAFAWRLRYLIEKMGSVLALAQAVGVSDSSVHLWLKKSEPSRGKLVALADAAGVSLEWLSAGTGPVQVDAGPPEGFFVVRQGYRMTPGAPVAFSTGYLALAVSSIYQDLISTFASGDAMAPTIRDLDLLLIDVTNRDKTDGVYVAIEAKPDLMIRRLQRRVNGGYRLLCDNPDYPPTEVEDLDIVGHVIWRGGKLP